MLLPLLAAALLALPGFSAARGPRPAPPPGPPRTLRAQDVPPAAETLAAARRLVARQDFAGARDLLAPLVEREPENAQAWYLYGYALHGVRELEAALAAHERAATFDAVRANASYNAACACALLGRPDDAFAWLTRAREAGFTNLALVATDPDLASLRADPRFAAYRPPEPEPPSFVEDVEVVRVLDGEAAGDVFGWIGRNAGDADGDGTTDLLISAPWRVVSGPACGRVYVFSGATGELLWERSGEPGFQLGVGISEAGDVDRDGHADALAGAVGARGTGMAFVYSGVDGATLLELAGEAAGDAFGRKVAGAGDLDGDGHPDLVVGAPGHDAAGADAGRAYVFSGKNGRRLLALDGEAPGDAFASTVDGYAGPDARLLIVGAKDAGEGDRGRVYVYRVRPAEGGPDDPALAAELAFTVDPAPDDVDLGRMFVSAVGDVDADGTVDVYASDWASHAGGVRGAGRVYVHSGRTGERLFTFDGTRPGEGFGIGTAEAGDVDGDGHADLLVGAWQNGEGAPSAGKCTLFSGADGRVLATWTGTNAGDTFGFDTTGLGDLDGDGRVELLVTSAYSPVHGPRTGRVLVIRAPARPEAGEGPR